jgi:hypothetical protein
MSAQLPSPSHPWRRGYKTGDRVKSRAIVLPDELQASVSAACRILDMPLEDYTRVAFRLMNAYAFSLDPTTELRNNHNRSGGTKWQLDRLVKLLASKFGYRKTLPTDSKRVQAALDALSQSTSGHR